MIDWQIPHKPHVASYRYRCSIPMNILQNTVTPDVTVIAKDWLTLKQVRSIRGPVVWDCCDDHFDKENDRADYYHEIANLVTAITVPTEGMRQRVLEATGKEALVVEDPYELPLAKPLMKSGWAQNLFWYGHKSNLRELIACRDDFGERKILVMSNFEGCIPWSHEGMLKGLGWCDVVPIPVGTDKKSQAKSPNRMVEAIRQGRYVVANPLPAYAVYGMWQGDLKEGLEWVDDNPDIALEAVRKAQKIVEEKHSPKVIAAQWLKVFQHVTSNLR
jgi:hypothetical protein